jgi:multisubunit Na+/H+ antiporter MnhC subunit
MIVLAQDKHASNIADTDTSQDKKNLFDNVSFAAVIASALAAATSLFLSTKIGLAGSIIGAAVAAGASSLAMQVYQSILSKSAEKIRHLSSAEDGADDLTASRQASQADQMHTKELSSDATVVQLRPTSLVDATTPCATSASGTRIAPESLRRASSTHQSRTQHKRAIIIACLAAFAALAITALVISFATAGQGIGSTTTFSSRGEETATTEDSSKEKPQASTDSQKNSPSTTNTNGSESSSGSASTSDNTGDSSSTSSADSGTSSSTTDSEESSSSQDSSNSPSGNSSDSGTSSNSQNSADSTTSNGNPSRDSGQTSSSTATNSADTSSKNTSSKTSSATN